MEEWFYPALKAATRALEGGGIAVIVLGTVAATAAALRSIAGGRSWEDAFGFYRSNIGRAILLGLEFLVAADIINTVAIEPSLQSLAILDGIILIRTFLSFSLEVEIEGRWPWDRHKGETEGTGSLPLAGDERSVPGKRL